jgi:hypothetical protein
MPWTPKSQKLGREAGKPGRQNHGGELIEEETIQHRKECGEDSLQGVSAD